MRKKGAKGGRGENGGMDHYKGRWGEGEGVRTGYIKDLEKIIYGEEKGMIKEMEGERKRNRKRQKERNRM